MKHFLTKGLYALQALLKSKTMACPFCGEYDYNVVFKKYKLVDICHCKNCQLYWTNPVFRLPRFYDWLYCAEGITSEIPKAKIDELLASEFKNSGKDFHKVLRWLKTITSGNRLLEFGSSWGYFLYQAKMFGFEAVGVEIAKKRARFGRQFLGTDIRGDLQELINAGKKFDIIFSAHTFEHLGCEIKKTIENLVFLLKDKGIIVIEVPRLDFSKGIKTFHIMGAVHPLGFTKDFFYAVLPSYGLKTEEILGYDGNNASRDGIIIVARKL